MLDPYQQYRSATVETASPAELVVLLYQGVIRFAQRAIFAIEGDDIARSHENLLRAQAIVIELASHLDADAGGEIAANLGALYEFAYRRLVDANCRKDAAPAQEVVDLFRELLPAWQTLAEGRPAALAAVPAAVGAGR